MDHYIFTKHFLGYKDFFKSALAATVLPLISDNSGNPDSIATNENHLFQWSQACALTFLEVFNGDNLYSNKAKCCFNEVRVSKSHFHYTFKLPLLKYHLHYAFVVYSC